MFIFIFEIVTLVPSALLSPEADSERSAFDSRSQVKLSGAAAIYALLGVLALAIDAFDEVSDLPLIHSSELVICSDVFNASTCNRCIRFWSCFL